MTTFRIQTPALPGNIVATSATPLPQFLTQKELCTALRLTRQTLNASIKQGILPAGIRLTKRQRVWRLSDIISRLA